MTSAISMNGLTKHYKGVEALTDLTLDVPTGTVFGFLGRMVPARPPPSRSWPASPTRRRAARPSTACRCPLPASTADSWVTSPRIRASTAG